MSILLNIGTKFSTSSLVNQIPLSFIVYKVISKSSTTCWNFVEKWIYTSKAYLAVKCGR